MTKRYTNRHILYYDYTTVWKSQEKQQVYNVATGYQLQKTRDSKMCDKTSPSKALSTTVLQCFCFLDFCASCVDLREKAEKI